MSRGRALNGRCIVAGYLGDSVSVEELLKGAQDALRQQQDRLSELWDEELPLAKMALRANDAGPWWEFRAKTAYLQSSCSELAKRIVELESLAGVGWPTVPIDR